MLDIKIISVFAHTFVCVCVCVCVLTATFIGRGLCEEAFRECGLSHSNDTIN